MDADRKDELQGRWVETWRQAGEALARVRVSSLRNTDYAKVRPWLDAMLDWVCQHSVPRPTSGLVEQQALFMKLRDSD